MAPGCELACLCDCADARSVLTMTLKNTKLEPTTLASKQDRLRLVISRPELMSAIRPPFFPYSTDCNVMQRMSWNSASDISESPF